MGTENLTAEERKKQIEEAEKSVKAMDDFTSPEKLYDELIASVRKYHPSDDKIGRASCRERV